MTRGRQAFWILVLVVIGVDLWWSNTAAAFDLWWLPLIALNVGCLAVILYPMIRGRD